MDHDDRENRRLNRRPSPHSRAATCSTGSPTHSRIVRKHDAEWSLARQARIDALVEAIPVGANWAKTKKAAVS